MNLKLKLKNKLVPNSLLTLSQKKKIFYIPPFKRNIEELKANITRINRGKKSYINAKVSKSIYI